MFVEPGVYNSPRALEDRPESACTAHAHLRVREDFGPMRERTIPAKDHTFVRNWFCQRMTGLLSVMTGWKNHHLMRSRESPFSGASGWTCGRDSIATP